MILVPATVAAAAMAYGIHPDWAAVPNGLEVILWSRRLQWPLAALSVGLCLAMLGLVISGRRRAWWLIGLAPVLALFAHRFVTDPLSGFVIVSNPQFIEAREAGFLRDEDYVVGLVFEGNAYAYPYGWLYAAPVVAQRDHDRRMLLMWSALANRALAVETDQRIRARQLEIVSMPANALLLYNAGEGEFINALTGLTPAGDVPVGFGNPIATERTTWSRWREEHPRTRVFPPIDPPGGPVAHAPFLPHYKLPENESALPDTAVVTMVKTEPPVAVPAGEFVEDDWGDVEWEAELYWGVMRYWYPDLELRR